MAFWGEYIPVAQRRASAKKKMGQLRKKGVNIQPIEIEGRKIAKSFWGKGWCDHLESFSDYSNRLPRGRTYARNGSVCHLDIQPGRVEGMVSGTSLYNVAITIQNLDAKRWTEVKDECSGQVGSILELLQGKLSKEVMTVVADRNKGLFPGPREIRLSCSCPDGARMCKHVAAVLYGVGHRLDSRPELLFLLRGVDAQELVTTQISLADADGEDTLGDDQLADIFGIDFDLDDDDIVPEASPTFESGECVREVRESLGLSVPQFAQRLGITAPTVRRWERSETLNLRPSSLALLREQV